VDAAAEKCRTATIGDSRPAGRSLPLTLINCNRLGFDADPDHKNYCIAHETIVRRDEGSSMGPISLAIFSFLNRIASRAPDFFRIPQDAIIEVGFRAEI